MHDPDAVAILERPHQRRRARGSADEDLLQAGDVRRVRVEVVQQVVPDRRDGAGVGRSLGRDELGQRRRLQEAVRQEQ